ncbi:STAS domain-containing protein [Streptomyces sp. NPDC055055]
MNRHPGRFALFFESGPLRPSARLSGDIDIDDASEVREALTAALDASRGGLDVDLAGVTFCDSSGLGALLAVGRQARQVGKSLVVTALSDPVAHLLHHVEVGGLGAPGLTMSDAHPAPGGASGSRVKAGRAVVFEIKARHFGRTVHLSFAGELDMDTRPVLDEMQSTLEGLDVVACDMEQLTFLDVAGLRSLLDFVSGLDSRGITFFACHWQPQPRRLLDLLDDRYPSGETDGPALLLRRLRDAADAARRVGAGDAARAPMPTEET